MEHSEIVLAQERANEKRRREAEAAASIYPNDKLRVRPTRYQAIASNTGQIIQFRPTEIIDDPHRIRIMDEHKVDYIVVSREKKPKKSADQPIQVAATSSGFVSVSVNDSLLSVVQSAIDTARNVQGIVPQGEHDAERATNDGMPEASDWKPADSE